MRAQLKPLFLWGILLPVIFLMGPKAFANASDLDRKLLESQKEGPVPRDFDWNVYLSNNPDLQAAGIDTKEKAIAHWINSGRKERRSYRPLALDFDWQTYLNNYPDLQKTGIDTEEKAVAHWLCCGEREGRIYRKLSDVPLDFDWETFVANYDLSKNDVYTKQAALDYWLTYGQYERKTYHKIGQGIGDKLPSDFDWKTYVSNYRDLQHHGIDTEKKAIQSWLLYGRDEGRTYYKIKPQETSLLPPDFDWKTYAGNYPALRKLGIDSKEKAIAHWFNHGKKMGWTYRKLE